MAADRAPRAVAGAAEVMETQVIVVGAGPVGLMLAAELCLRGVRVSVVE